MLRPVDLNTAFHHRRAEDKRAVDKVVQAGGIRMRSRKI
jgi:hypothetical protein